ACGVLQLAFDKKEAERQNALAEAFPEDLLRAVTRTEAEQLAGVALASGGLYFPDSGWVHPPALCRWLSDQPGIEVLRSREALELRREDGLWQACNDDRLLAQAPVVVLAGAADVARLHQSAWVPLKRIRGQITALPA